MEPGLKARLDHRAVARLISYNLGIGPGEVTSQEISDGFFASVYRVALSDGRRYVLKAAPSPTVRVMRYERDIMTTEVALMRMLREQTSAPLADLVCHDVSRELIESNFVIMSCIDGEPLSQSRDRL